MWYLLFLLPMIVFPAYAQSPPDYYNPYAPIFTDKGVYSWTEKVRITIVAPSWNADKNKIDSIGEDKQHFIQIATREQSLKPYRLLETGVSSGVFTGEVTLTGFSHDVDGDGFPDTTPRTGGSGPTNGFLETSRDSSITISFEFADGVVLTHSAGIIWNIGQVDFIKSNYLITEQATIRVIDPDMNLNPESIDNFDIDVWSDHDSGGIVVSVSETNQATGVFTGTMIFSHNQGSSGNRLFAMPGDKIFAKYIDRSLPRPYSVTGELSIASSAKLESNIPPLERLVLVDNFLADSSGRPVGGLVSNTQVQIVGVIQNTQDYDQNFIYFIQVKDQTGAVVTLSWIKAQLGPNQQLDLSQSWTPNSSGNFEIETFVWDSFQNSLPLSSPLYKSYFVK